MLPSPISLQTYTPASKEYAAPVLNHSKVVQTSWLDQALHVSERSKYIAMYHVRVVETILIMKRP